MTLLLCSCLKEEIEDDYVAKVNNEYLRFDEFKSMFDETKWAEMNRKDKENYLREWVNLTSLAQKCDEAKITELPIIQQKINNSTKKIKANALIAKRLNELIINEEDIFNYYQLHKRAYQKRITEYKYQRIVISDEDKFKQAVDELKEGNNFKEVAIKYSDEPAGRTGGYMGFASAGDVAQEIWDTLETLDQHRWKSVKLDDKFYLLRWYEKREADIEKTYAEIKDSLKILLIEERNNEKYAEILKEIEYEYDIEINYLRDGDI